MDALIQDLRYALRQLAKSPGFTAIAVLTLALGIGANTAIFSVIDALILRKLPVKDPGALYYLKRDETAPRSFGFLFRPDLEAYQNLHDVFAGVAGVIDIDGQKVGRAGSDEIDQARVSLVSGSYFPMLGINSNMGRLLGAENDRGTAADPVAVISQGYLQRRFGGNRDVLGRALTIGGTTVTIVGVVPAAFLGDVVGSATDIWLPLPLYPSLTGQSGTGFAVQRLIARLDRGVPLARAQAALDVTAPPLAQQRLAVNPRIPASLQRTIALRVVLAPAAEGYSLQRLSLRPALVVLMAMAVIVLLTACANVANLLLVRSTARQREMAMRVALGADGSRVVRQVLTETVLIAALGGLFGLLFDLWATRAFTRFVGSAWAGMLGLGSLNLDVNPDLRILTLAGSACLLTGIAFGLVPAIRASRSSPGTTLTRRGADASGAFGLGKLLVVSQVGMSVMLMMGAALFLRTLHNLRTEDLGYDREHLLLVSTHPGQAYTNPTDLVSWVQRVQQRLVAVAGVRSVSASSAGILNGIELNYGGTGAIRVERQDPRDGGSWTRSVVTPGFLATAGLALAAGREFTEGDAETAPPVVMINETLARFEFGSTANALGRHLGVFADSGTPREIVGVVRDAKYNTARDQNMGMMYLPYRQRPNELANVSLVIRSTGDPAQLASTVRQEVVAMDPGVPIARIESLDNQLDLTLVRERLIAGLAGGFGGLTVLLACLGLYGVISYTVARRIGEIGVRMALGASQGVVLGRVFGQSMVLVLAGATVGVPAALLVGRFAAKQLFGVQSTDPLVIGSAIAIVSAVAAAASLLPARRAARVDPMVALRSE